VAEIEYPRKSILSAHSRSNMEILWVINKTFLEQWLEGLSIYPASKRS
jgi:hypothetical protein